MQRLHEAELRAKLQSEQDRAMKESHWVLHEESTSVISLEESILFDNYTPGRRSFKGFNASIESVVATREREERQKDGTATKEDDDDVVLEEATDAAVAHELGRGRKRKVEDPAASIYGLARKHTAKRQRVGPPQRNNNDRKRRPFS
eukprot:TRINITY_DN4150_c0_g1_i2.p2 TRINITY_DN4150_c0_g1~~TRINITY_DN4150_c0_g1_i2.p2  ORF type:complete len:147 (+),score=51.97 TRINITY_DN4150_c0_g1_i2:144-584(+)